MELLGQNRGRLLVPPYDIRPQLPPYLRLMFGLLSAIIVIVAGTMALTRSQQPPTDPFSDFGDLFNDNAYQSALMRGFTCGDIELGGDRQPISNYCFHRDLDNTFSSIYLRTIGSITDEMSFTLRENILRLGDLAVLWGKPTIRLYCDTAVAYWSTGRVMVILARLPTGSSNYFTPITSISFTRGAPSQSERLLMNEALRSCG